jgi:hypothetical protein
MILRQDVAASLVLIPHGQVDGFQSLFVGHTGIHTALQQEQKGLHRAMSRS